MLVTLKIFLMDNALQSLFQAFTLPDNSSENSILNQVLQLNLVQQTFFNPNIPVSFYCLIEH